MYPQASYYLSTGLFTTTVSYMDIIALVTIIAGLVSVCAAVFSVWFTRRDSDAELKADVEELALLVERMGKAQRRERMARVRQGAGNDNSTPAGSEAPQSPLDFPTDIKSRKQQLRRQFMRANP